MKEAVAAIIVGEDGQVVIAKKKPGESLLSGKWHIPGETLVPKESDFNGLKRCALEELGISLLPGAKLIAEHITPKKTPVRWYECQTPDSRLIPGSDIEAARWVNRLELVSMCDPEVTAMWPQTVLAYFAN